jgi:RNA polymerase sigma-70 factor (ECF subfamily)
METSSPPTSLTLLGQLRLPDQPAAWGQFVQLYTPLLEKWARRQGFRDADAADLTQEVLVKLMKELPDYQRGPGQSFRGWLFRVTANVCRDFRRRKATRALPGADGLSQANDGPPLVEFEEAEYRKALVDGGLKAIRGEFEPQTWTAFEQLMVQNRPAAEVAAALDMTKGAVYSAQSRVLARLREVIDEFLD